MRHPLKCDLLSGIYQKLKQSLNFLRKRVVARTAMLWMLGFGAIGSATVLAQDSKFVLDRDGRTIVLEPYAPNILRVTLSRCKAIAAGVAGYGIVGTPSMTGWAHELDAGGDDIFRSNRLVVRVSGDETVRRRLWLVPFRDAIHFVVWLASFASNKISWGGEQFTMREGRMTPLPRP